MSVLDDDRLRRPGHPRERGRDLAKHLSRQHVAHVPAQELLGGEQEPAGIRRVTVEEDAVHRLQEHQIRHGGEDGIVPSVRLPAA